MRPRDEPEPLRALEQAEAENLSVTPYGAGTSVVGGVDPIPGPRHDGAMSLDLSRLDSVLEVDPVARAAVGRMHRPWYDRQRPEPFAAGLRAVKAALDPGSRLNPGVL